MIRDVVPSDAYHLTKIYNYYIKNTIITFEELEISTTEMSNRIKRIKDNAFPFLVFEKDNQILGYAYADKWRERNAYRFTLETTVYLDPNHFGKGMGELLYKELIKHLRKNGIASAIGVISIPNEGSIHLHEKLGFKKVGIFEKVGYKFDKWIDVGFWELIL